MKTLIENGLLIDPANQIQAYLNLVLEDGRVAAVTEECPEADSVIDAAGRVVAPAEVIDEIFAGMSSMLPITFVLLFGFTMGNVVKALDTGNYLSSIFQQFLSPALLPALTFLMALMISFATGTSMGTMAIMAVIALPMGYSMGINIPLVAGAMFGGSIFGEIPVAGRFVGYRKNRCFPYNTGAGGGNDYK